MLSNTEENYLKAIYQLSDQGTRDVSTSAIAADLDTTASSVTDMIKKLSVKKLLDYIPYQGVRITRAGKTNALKLIRKHRLWETFLVEKLGFQWDEVHAVAEQLEHVKSEHLIEKIDKFLGYPKVDPHGDAIPDKNGVIKHVQRMPLAEVGIGKKVIIAGVDDAPALLQFLDKIGAKIGTELSILDILEFDGSFEVSVNKKKVFISREIAENIQVV